ncbi:hypothetical protein [Mucilaginibacter sp.]
MNLLEPYNFMFELPLYSKIVINENNARDFFSLMQVSQSIEGYNPILKQETTYHIRTKPSDGVSYQQKEKIFAYEGLKSIVIVCARNGFTITTYFDIYKIYDDKDNVTYILTKIGQNPSIADLHISKIREYHKVLSKDKLKEFTKAVGLAANGVGIGSFVYLRRVFEDLIEQAHLLSQQDKDWDEMKYKSSKMNERIEQLKHHLPGFLVENKILYSILSKGIHELEENECLQYFEVVKAGIELILDEKVDDYNKKKKIDDARKKIQNVTEQLAKD